MNRGLPKQAKYGQTKKQAKANAARLCAARKKVSRKKSAGCTNISLIASEAASNASEPNLQLSMLSVCQDLDKSHISLSIIEDDPALKPKFNELKRQYNFCLAMWAVKDAMHEQNFKKLTKKRTEKILLEQGFKVSADAILKHIRASNKDLHNVSRQRKMINGPQLIFETEPERSTAQQEWLTPVTTRRCPTVKVIKQARKFIIEQELNTKLEPKFHRRLNLLPFARRFPEFQNASRLAQKQFPLPEKFCIAISNSKRHIKKKDITIKTEPDRWGDNRRLIEHEAVTLEMDLISIRRDMERPGYFENLIVPRDN